MSNRGFFYSRESMDWCTLTVMSQNSYICKPGSLQYAQGKIIDSSNSYIVFGDNSLYSSKIEVNNAMNNTLCYIGHEGLMNGEFSM